MLQKKKKGNNLQLHNFLPYCQMHHYLDWICMIYCAYVFSLSPSPELFPIEAISAAGACRLSLSFPTCKISSAESKSLSAYSLISYFFYPSIAKLCCSVTTAYCRKKLISTSNSIHRLHTNMCHWHFLLPVTSHPSPHSLSRCIMQISNVSHCRYSFL